jgi:hypothetical protein
MSIQTPKPPEHRAAIPRRRIRKLAYTALAAGVAVVVGVATPALAAVQENWTANSTRWTARRTTSPPPTSPRTSTRRSYPTDPPQAGRPSVPDGRPGGSCRIAAMPLGSSGSSPAYSTHGGDP